MTVAVLPPIIGINGYGQVGKSWAAEHLRAAHGYVGHHINEPMVDMAVPLLKHMGIAEDEARLCLTTARKDDAIPGFPWLTYRRILQVIGKDLRDQLGRETTPDRVDPGFFNDLWASRYPPGTRLLNESVRYPHEAAWIRSRGGIILRIEKVGAKPANDHESEALLPADLIVGNFFDGMERYGRRIDDALQEWTRRQAA